MEQKEDGTFKGQAVDPPVAPLFRPIKLGRYQLAHRIALAPMTRCRAVGGVPQLSMVLYYAQRSTPGGFLISEGTLTDPTAYGWPNTPGIHTQEQIEAWKQVVDAVHAKGGIIFCQLWHCGRSSIRAYQPDQAPPLSSTTAPLDLPYAVYVVGEDGKQLYKVPCDPPRSVAAGEIQQLVHNFRIAARNAITAGFDGVEIHGGHGYLIDQFLKDSINQRTDEYGGTLQNRCRFAVQVLEAVVDEVGADRVGFRLSPFASHGASSCSDPLELGTYMFDRMNELNLAYIHLTEPEFRTIMEYTWTPEYHYFTKLRKLPLLVSGGHTRDTAVQALEIGYADLVAFGRSFTSNPDLVQRFAKGAICAPFASEAFFKQDQVIGYTDFPAMQEVEG